MHTCIFAANAARTPFGASSNTNTWPQASGPSTGGEKRLAHTYNYYNVS